MQMKLTYSSDDHRQKVYHLWERLLVVVVVLGFYVPPTAKVIRRRDLSLKYHPKDWRSPGSNSRPLV